jgi:hypothetical protein
MTYKACFSFVDPLGPHIEAIIRDNPVFPPKNAPILLQF